jgi:hypothetical protein
VSVSPLRGAAAALLAVLLAGCGDAPAPTVSAPSTLGAASTTSPAATTSPTATAAPTAAAAPAPAPAPAPRPAVTLLPWPTADPARLQAAVDGGASPWLLDPTDLALSYVTATYDWTAADASPAAGTAAATEVDVRNTDGKRRVLTVAQPGRRGNGGIWVVTADTTG